MNDLSPLDLVAKPIVGRSTILELQLAQILKTNGRYTLTIHSESLNGSMDFKIESKDKILYLDSREFTSTGSALDYILERANRQLKEQY